MSANCSNKKNHSLHVAQDLYMGLNSSLDPNQCKQGLWGRTGLVEVLKYRVTLFICSQNPHGYWNLWIWALQILRAQPELCSGQIPFEGWNSNFQFSAKNHKSRFSTLRRASKLDQSTVLVGFRGLQVAHPMGVPTDIQLQIFRTSGYSNPWVPNLRILKATCIVC